MIARLIVRMLASFLTHRNYASQVPFSYFCSTPESSAQVVKLGHIFWRSSAAQGDVLRKQQRLAAESLSCKRSAHGVKSDHIDGAAVKLLEGLLRHAQITVFVVQEREGFADSGRLWESACSSAESVV
jgi:hypothetical protein